MIHAINGEYAAALKQAEEIPDPKVVRWQLDHVEVLTGEDIPKPPADDGDQAS